MLGSIDARKMRSSMTLFHRARTRLDPDHGLGVGPMAPIVGVPAGLLARRFRAFTRLVGELVQVLRPAVDLGREILGNGPVLERRGERVLDLGSALRRDLDGLIDLPTGNVVLHTPHDPACGVSSGRDRRLALLHAPAVGIPDRRARASIGRPRRGP
jgi:hypothetical protein